MGTPQELKLSTAYKTVRRKFYQSIFKWFADDTVNEETKSASPPDVGDLVNILRSIGFKLREFDKCDHRRDYSMSTSTSSLNSAEGLKIADCRVEITCGHSGLRAILESVEGECRCPPIESATQAKFWQVSGSAPVALGSQESIGSVQEAGSSLVPPLAPAVAAVVKDIMIRVLNITCDPEFGELDTSRHSLAGNSYLNVSHHRSLDTLPLAHSSRQLYGSETEIAECAEQTKKLLPRTTSNVELSACSESPVSRSGSAGDLIKHHEPRDSIETRQHSSSPMSNLSASLERITLTERHGIFCRLEFAKRSITEAMAMLQVQPLPVDTTLHKLRPDNTSTPSSQVKISRNLKKMPGSPAQTKKISGTPGSVQKMPSTPGYVKKIPGPTGEKKKMPGSSGSIKKISGIQKGINKTSASPGSVSPRVRTQSSTSVASSISGRTQSSYPQCRKLPDGLPKQRIKLSPHPTNKFVSPGLVSTTKKLTDVPSSDAVFHAPSNLSTESSSSASSASSTKARKFINAVRRVSRMSSSGGTPNSKPS